jgi:hypothetical protein
METRKELFLLLFNFEKAQKEIAVEGLAMAEPMDIIGGAPVTVRNGAIHLALGPRGVAGLRGKKVR